MIYSNFLKKWKNIKTKVKHVGKTLEGVGKLPV